MGLRVRRVCTVQERMEEPVAVKHTMMAPQDKAMSVISMPAHSAEMALHVSSTPDSSVFASPVKTAVRRTNAVARDCPINVDEDYTARTPTSMHRTSKVSVERRQETDNRAGKDPFFRCVLLDWSVMTDCAHHAAAWGNAARKTKPAIAVSATMRSALLDICVPWSEIGSLLEKGLRWHGLEIYP